MEFTPFATRRTAHHWSSPAAIHLLQVLVPERACSLCYCPRLLPCYLPLRCCGTGFGGLEDLHSAQCHSGQRTGADLEVGPHRAGPLQSGGHDLGAGCSHPPRLVYHLRLHPLKLSTRALHLLLVHHPLLPYSEHHSLLLRHRPPGPGPLRVPGVDDGWLQFALTSGWFV